MFGKMWGGLSSLPSPVFVGLERLRNDAFQPMAGRSYTCTVRIAGHHEDSPRTAGRSTTVPALQNDNNIAETLNLRPTHSDERQYII